MSDQPIVDFIYEIAEKREAEGNGVEGVVIKLFAKRVAAAIADRDAKIRDHIALAVDQGNEAYKTIAGKDAVIEVLRTEAEASVAEIARLKSGVRAIRDFDADGEFDDPGCMAAFIFGGGSV